MESKILYFEEMKAENSDTLLALVKEKAREKGIKHVVVASTRGGTGVKAGEVFKDSGINVVAVTHQIGPQGPELLVEHEERMKALGVKIVTCTHAFGGVGAVYGDPRLEINGLRPTGLLTCRRQATSLRTCFASSVQA